MLSREDQDTLALAIETAVDILHEEQFVAWLRGPLQALLPHAGFARVELGSDNTAWTTRCYWHSPVDAALADAFCDPYHGLGARLALAHRADRRRSCVAAGEMLDALCRGRSEIRRALRNAVLHRLDLPSGRLATAVFCNVAEDRLVKVRWLLRLLSPNLRLLLRRFGAVCEAVPHPPLTPREREILVWMKKGKSNREISALLAISAITLKSHVNKLYRKLDVQCRADAVARVLVTLKDESQ